MNENFHTPRLLFKEAPFNVPEAVEWSQLGDALQSKFKVQTGTSRPLSKSDLEYLAEKLLGHPLVPGQNNIKISLARFCKVFANEIRRFLLVEMKNYVRRLTFFWIFSGSNARRR